LAEVLKLLPTRVGTPDLYLPLGQMDGRQLLADIQTSAEQMDDSQISLLDGVRLDFNDGFGIIRQSNTGPFMTARFDGDSPESLHRIRQIFHDLVSPYHPDMAQRLTE
jgi:phosphomannomutase/phosphoglucomutase